MASKILEALDRDTNPCEDFYQYSCGGWIKRNPLPDGRSKWSTFNSIWDQNQAIMKHLLGGCNPHAVAALSTQPQRIGEAGTGGECMVGWMDKILPRLGQGAILVNSQNPPSAPLTVHS